LIGFIAAFFDRIGGRLKVECCVVTLRRSKMKLCVMWGFSFFAFCFLSNVFLTGATNDNFPRLSQPCWPV
jgi:hypothetical protein